MDDVDLAAPDDRRLVDRFEVVLAEVRLKRDVDGLGQVLERALTPAFRGFTCRAMSRRPPAFRAVTVPGSPEPAAMATLIGRSPGALFTGTVAAGRTGADRGGADGAAAGFGACDDAGDPDADRGPGDFDSGLEDGSGTGYSLSRRGRGIFRLSY